MAGKLEGWTEERGANVLLSLFVRGSNKTSNQRAKINVETLMHSEYWVNLILFNGTVKKLF